MFFYLTIDCVSIQSVLFTFRESDQAIKILVDCGCETNASDGVEILVGLPHDFYK
ncbi:putative glutamate synthase (NADH) [Helianthus anomalus]